jgi:hypothetical protein
MSQFSSRNVLILKDKINFGALDVTIPSDSTSENNSDIKTIQQIPVKICRTWWQRLVKIIFRTKWQVRKGRCEFAFVVWQGNNEIDDTTGANCETGTAFLSGAPGVAPRVLVRFLLNFYKPLSSGTTNFHGDLLNSFDIAVVFRCRIAWYCYV